MRKTKTWLQYEAGREYKRRIGLYEAAARNESYYRGEQWEAQTAERALPRPVFNVVRRITDYLVGAVAGGRLTVTYSDDSAISVAPEVKSTLEMLNAHVSRLWDSCHMDRLGYRLLLDAALTGDGVVYCYHDKESRSGIVGGNIRTVRHDACELYAADMNRADIQSQDYIILAGRESVRSLRREARELGLSTDAIGKIRSDAMMSFDPTGRIPELDDEESAKATVLLKFWREGGAVWYEKSTAEVVIRRAKTGLHLYPVAYFNWMPTRAGFHGTAPVSGMIANQRFINRAYAMVMKHMTDTAFSKVIYDKSRIPEWTNEVGEAIAAVGGSPADAVQVVGTGQLQDGYMALIENAIEMTKELSGATDTVLGSAQANNTSAILALQEASRTALHQVSASYIQCLEDVAAIWADMLCALWKGKHTVMGKDGADGEVDIELVRGCLLHARVEVGNLTQYSASGTQNTLDRLLDGGYITLKQYLEQLPEGILPLRGRLLGEIEESSENEEGGEAIGDGGADADADGIGGADADGSEPDGGADTDGDGADGLGV